MKPISVFFTYAKYSEYRRKQQQDQAIQILAKAPEYVNVFCLDFYADNGGMKYGESNDVLHGIKQLAILKNNSANSIGNTRQLPFIKEIMDCASEYSGSSYNVFGYINSDILVPEKVWSDILQRDHDAFMFSRSDIAEVTISDFNKGMAKVIYGGDKHAGVDGFFFNTYWWRKNRNLFPDRLVVGETEWDTCYRHIIKNHCTNYYAGRDIYHVYHDSKWTLNSPGAKINISIWESIKHDKD